MPGMEDSLGVPADGNPERSSESVVLVLGGAQGMFEGAVPVRDILYDVEQGPRTIDDEPSFEDRVKANAQMEASRLAKIKDLGFDVSSTKPFEYADTKPSPQDARKDVPTVFDLLVTVPEVDLDFDEDVVDENGDIVDDDEFTVDVEAFPDAVQSPSDPPKRGRPRKQ